MDTQRRLEIQEGITETKALIADLEKMSDEAWREAVPLWCGVKTRQEDINLHKRSIRDMEAMLSHPEYESDDFWYDEADYDLPDNPEMKDVIST